MAAAGARTGLLARAEQYLGSCTDDNPPAFYLWAAENHVHHAVILKPAAETYVPVHAVGMDAQSLVRCCSSPDFWDGTLEPIAGWQFFETSADLTPFYQILSDAYRQLIDSLYILRVGSAILIVSLLEDEEPPVLSVEKAARCVAETKQMPNLNTRPTAGSLAKGLHFSPAHFFILSLKLATETAIKDCAYANTEIQASLHNALYTELHAQCKTLFQSPNCTHSGTDDEIKIVFFSKQDPDEALLRFHISKSFAAVLGTSPAQRIVLMKAGTGLTEHEAAAFLTQG
ncbi:MAG: hypothetical protein K6G80_05890 [Treponema sp.]|nr:hypothetical protein [Treponema sp.]